MAENAELMENEVNERNVEYEKRWIIPNWDKVQRREDLVTNLSFELETGKDSDVYTKWLIGFKLCNPATHFRFYWILVESKGFENCCVKASINCEILVRDGLSGIWRHDAQKKTISQGDLVEIPFRLPFNSNSWKQLINQNGEVVFKLFLIIIEPDKPTFDMQMKRFNRISVTEVQTNFAKLLDDITTSDLKIITRDHKELFAHKIILIAAQCPVFKSMFRSEFCEKTSGCVNLDDIHSETMRIILHLFYSGELLLSWKNPQTILEFVYAAGKYQMDSVLRLLDHVIGTRDNDDATYIDIQLLDIVQKLGLKNAEKDLMARIRKTINKMKTGAQLFALWGIQTDTKI